MEFVLSDVIVISLATLEYDEDTVNWLLAGLYRIAASICKSLVPVPSTNVTYLLELSLFDVIVISLAMFEYDEDTVNWLLAGLYRIAASMCKSLVPVPSTNVTYLLELSLFDVIVISLAMFAYEADVVNWLVDGLYRIPASICKSLVPVPSTNVRYLLELALSDVIVISLAMFAYEADVVKRLMVGLYLIPASVCNCCGVESSPALSTKVI